MRGVGIHWERSRKEQDFDDIKTSLQLERSCTTGTLLSTIIKHSVGFPQVKHTGQSVCVCVCVCCLSQSALRQIENCMKEESSFLYIPSNILIPPLFTNEPPGASCSPLHTHTH